MTEQKFERRQFLKTSLVVATGAIVIPTIIPSWAKGANDKITIGMIGVGIHGTSYNLKSYLNIPDKCQVVAVCDVDEGLMQKARLMVDEAKGGKGCKTFSDFRDILARNDIDAVQISTPDHWHVHQAIMALQAGKDVCCEKPTWTIDLGRKLVNAVDRSSRIFQTSLEDRSVAVYYRMAQLARNGHIGKITKMRVGLPVNFNIRPADTSAQPVPKGLDWEMWLGPAPFSPYSPGRTNGNFRWCSDYSLGTISDWGAHLIDDAQWCNGTEKWGPVEVEGIGSALAEGYYNNFIKYNLTFRYGNGTELKVHSNGLEIYIEGDKGWLLVEGWNKPLQASDPELLTLDLNREKVQLYTAKNEHVNFLDCIRSRKATYHPVEDMHRTATIAQMGCIAMTLQRKLQWDPAKEEFVNDAEANAMRHRKERDPWKLEDLIVL
jgi:predicted dehydrogenase